MRNSSEENVRSDLTRAKRFIFVIFSVVLCLIIVEAGLHLAYYLMHRGDSDVPDQKMLLSVYKDKQWARQYFTEMHNREIQYEPYYGWSLKEFHGQYINIDSSGLRKTWNPDFAGSSPPETLFVFGGSTIWGGGARDDYSIPSMLSRSLDESGYRINVVNYGTTGHVFGQEVVRLMKALWDGHRPDYVIFCDGTNDVYSAYQSGIAGTFQNLERTRERMRILSATEHLAIGTKQFLDENCMICRAIKRIFRAISGAEQTREEAAAHGDYELQQLSMDIVRSYRQAAELLAHLAQQYDFKYICLWQPVGILEDKLTPEELASDNRFNDKALAALFRCVNDSLPTDPTQHFFNMSDALAERPGTVYIDFCHVTEEGNEIIADAIMIIFDREIGHREQAGHN